MLGYFQSWENNKLRLISQLIYLKYLKKNIFIKLKKKPLNVTKFENIICFQQKPFFQNKKKYMIFIIKCKKKFFMSITRKYQFGNQTHLQLWFSIMSIKLIGFR